MRPNFLTPSRTTSYIPRWSFQIGSENISIKVLEDVSVQPTSNVHMEVPSYVAEREASREPNSTGDGPMSN